MERYALNKLIEWNRKKNRKPLILKGARQVGKTWLMKEFGKRYCNYSEPILKAHCVLLRPDGR